MAKLRSLHDSSFGGIGIMWRARCKCARRLKKRIFTENISRNGRTEAAGGWGGGHPLFIISLLSRPRARLREVADQTTYVSVYDHWGGLDGH